MGVGIAFVLSVIVAIMIIPTAYSDDDKRYLSYEEKKQKQLNQHADEYVVKKNNEGGPPTEELIDFQQIRLDEITELEKGLVELKKLIDIKISDVKTQNEVIQKEQVKINAAKEKLKNEWGSPPIDRTQIKIEHEILNEITNELAELQDQYKMTLKQIDSKQILYEIEKNAAKLIGVELSKTCIAMAKTGLSTCPTYEDLYSLDKSLVEFSGEFSMKDGWFHREL